MKKGWQTKTLGELCDVLDHKRKPITKRDRVAGEYPYYGATGVLDHVAGYLFDEPLVLVGEDGAKWASGENTAFAVDGKIWVNNHAHVLRPHRTVLLDNWLIYPLIHSDLNKFVSGLTVPKLNQGSLREIPVPVPPLAEQQRIVGLLDEAFEGIATAKANAEKNLQNARALFESHLQSVFTQRGPWWVEKPFEDCIKDVKYTTKIQRKDFLEEGEFPIVSQEAEFTNGYWDNAADVFKVTRPIVIFGDHTQVIKYIDFDFVLGADGVKLLPPKPFLNPKFFFYALRSARLKSLGYARHYRLLKELKIGYPDANAQVAIAKKLDALETETQRLAHLYEQKLAALEALKKSLLHQAFSGELR